MSTSEMTVYRQQAWELTDLLPDAGDRTLEARLAELESAVKEFEARRAALDGLDSRGLLALLADYESIVERMRVLASYGSLWFAADTQSQAALTFRNRVEHRLTGLENRILFFSLWWKGLDDERAQELLPDGGEHPDQRHFLLDLRRLRPFTLEERSEQIINLKDANGMDAVLTLYSMLTNRLSFELEVDGEPRTLTRDELSALFFSPDPDLRAAAYRELYRVYGNEATVLGQIYVNRVRDWHSENLELRGFASPLAVRNVANDVPDRAVEVLLEVVRERAPLFQRYFRLKARMLGLERLRRYDLYAPVAAAEKRIPYSEAVSLVLGALGDFHPRVGTLAERVFADRHIDSEIRKGKKGGAFCATVLPSHTPWLLVNYTGRVRDVATLAHELGHAIHSMLAEDHSPLTQHASLPLAETASVFCEMLLTDRLLREESDRRVRRELLATAVDDIYATVLRQTFFVLFEQAAHRAVLEGRSPEELNRIYAAGLADQFGDSLDLAPEFEREWIAIPHIFHTPFYCYSYSFGQLLVLALYRRYQQEGAGFIPGYLRLLAHGGSARPEEILREAGIDMTDPDFWRGGFEVVSGMIDELE